MSFNRSHPPTRTQRSPHPFLTLNSSHMSHLINQPVQLPLPPPSHFHPSSRTKKHTHTHTPVQTLAAHATRHTPHNPLSTSHFPPPSRRPYYLLAGLNSSRSIAFPFPIPDSLQHAHPIGLEKFSVADPQYLGMEDRHQACFRRHNITDRV
jgi:hypothetical protein